MTSKNLKAKWRAAAKQNFETEKAMAPLHRPPSTGCIVEWRGKHKIGMIQWPIAEIYPDIVLLSITSVYDAPAFITYYRKLDPHRLELSASDSVELETDLATHRFLHRTDNNLEPLTPEETVYVEGLNAHFLECQPTETGVRFEEAPHDQKVTER